MLIAIHRAGSSVASIVPRLASAAALVLGVVAAQPVVAQGEQSGVFASGSIGYFYFACSTCSNPAQQVFSDAAGGFGSTGPAIIDGFDARGTGRASVDARALIIGANMLPELGAKASATPGIGTHPGFSGDNAYLFNASASAAATQYFTYSGSAPTRYELTYTLSGSATNFESPPSDVGNGLITVSGGVTIFDGLNPDIELPMGQYVDGHQSFANAGNGTFSLNGTVGIDVQPGDSFYVNAFLAANVANFGWGVADANDTLTMGFSAGDTALLAHTLRPVPEPASVAQILLGLLSLGALSLRTRRR